MGYAGAIEPDMNTDPNALKEEGVRLYREGSYAEAAARFSAARPLYAAQGEAGLAGEMLNNLGLCRRAQKQWDAARTALEEALAEFRALGDRAREAQALGNLGALAEAQGDKPQAGKHYEQAAEIFKELGDRENRAHTLQALSALQLKEGRHFEALATMEAGLEDAPKLSVQKRLLRRLIQWPMRMLTGR